MCNIVVSKHSIYSILIQKTFHKQQFKEILLNLHIQFQNMIPIIEEYIDNIPRISDKLRTVTIAIIGDAPNKTEIIKRIIKKLDNISNSFWCHFDCDKNLQQTFTNDFEHASFSTNQDNDLKTFVHLSKNNLEKKTICIIHPNPKFLTIEGETGDTLKLARMRIQNIVCVLTDYAAIENWHFLQRNFEVLIILPMSEELKKFLKLQDKYTNNKNDLHTFNFTDHNMIFHHWGSMTPTEPQKCN